MFSAAAPLCHLPTSPVNMAFHHSSSASSCTYFGSDVLPLSLATSQHVIIACCTLLVHTPLLFQSQNFVKAWSKPLRHPSVYISVVLFSVTLTSQKRRRRQILRSGTRHSDEKDRCRTLAIKQARSGVGGLACRCRLQSVEICQHVRSQLG